MLVVISDLHFVDGTAGKHNLPTEAFSSVFLSSIVALAEDKKATELKLLFLGDIPDLIRSQKWLEVEPKDRPWGKNGLADIPTPRPNSLTEQCCLDILGRFPDEGKRSSVPKDTILWQNWYTFEFFRFFKEVIQHRLKKPIPVELIYLVGNHDRLCNLYPSVRDEWQKIMGLTISHDTIEGEPNGEWWYPYEYLNEAYGVFARHGHQFDSANYAGERTFTRLDHLQVPIGDLVATEFAVNLPYTLEKLREKYPTISKQLIENLQDIDNVRPLRHVIEWFYHQVENQNDPDISRALDETFDQVIHELLEIEFVEEWRAPGTFWDEFIRAFSSSWLQWIPEGLLKVTRINSLLPQLLPIIERSLDSNEEVDDYTKAAFEEPIRTSNPAIRYLLYGHTHQSVLHALSGDAEGATIYLNTGTWRTRIRRTIPLDTAGGFVSLKQMTYTVFYNADEDLDDKEPDTISFDIWTGHKQKFYRA